MAQVRNTGHRCTLLPNPPGDSVRALFSSLEGAAFAISPDTTDSSPAGGRGDQRTADHRDLRRAPAPPPPKRIPAPRTKPKSYQLPLLCTSYRLTLSVNREMTKVTGAMNPCHNPSQNPATSPLSAVAPTSGLTPGAQAASSSPRTTTTARNPNVLTDGRSESPDESLGLIFLDRCNASAPM